MTRRVAEGGGRRVLGCVFAMMFGGLLVMPVPAEGAAGALEALLEVLRSKGSISQQEYEAIRALAAVERGRSTPAGTESTTTPSPASQSEPGLRTVAYAVPLAVVHPQVPSPTPVPATAAAQVDTAAVTRALSGRWYEKLGLRGYTQFRFSEVLDSKGAVQEVPADRSVNANESLVLRRGRFVVSGDATERLTLYAQMDLNGSTGTGDFAVQMRDLYADVALDKAKAWRVRLGQSKVPYGFANMQSSQNRAPLERPDATNSGAEGERDLGAFLMWAPPVARQRFRDLANATLKGSGDYGVVALGAYAGQGPNRPDQDGGVHMLGRVSYPFKTTGGRYFELGVQGYAGRFVSPVQAVTINGASVTPTVRTDGVRDERLAVTFVLYPQPFGIEAEWTAGHGPTLSRDSRSIELDSLHGGHLQFSYRTRSSLGTWFPFTRWSYFDGARKFARNAPRDRVNEVDVGVEFARWAEFELTGMFTHTFQRTRTSTYPYDASRRGSRIGFQAQWNY